MPIPFMTILPILAGVGKYILEVPLVHRWIENYCAGTPTIWDNILWRALEAAAGINSPEGRAAEVEAATARVQAQYDEVKNRIEAGEPEKEAFEAVTGEKLQELMGNA